MQNGVRGLMLDLYDFEDKIWCCHSFKGECYDVTAFVSTYSFNKMRTFSSPAAVSLIPNCNGFNMMQDLAVKTLTEVKDFMAQNPAEIVTIFIEDYVKTPNRLAKVFQNSGLDKYMFPLAKMPKNGEDWPTVDEMVKQNHRLVVFSSKAAKEAEGIAYLWKYVVETQCEFDSAT